MRANLLLVDDIISIFLFLFCFFFFLVRGVWWVFSYANTYASVDAVAAGLNITQIAQRLLGWQNVYRGLPSPILRDGTANLFNHLRSSMWTVRHYPTMTHHYDSSLSHRHSVNSRRPVMGSHPPHPKKKTVTASCNGVRPQHPPTPDVRNYFRCDAVHPKGSWGIQAVGIGGVCRLVQPNQR